MPDFEAYVVLRRLLRGPIYELYLARHTALDRLVLLKALNGQWLIPSPAARTLEREARLLGQLAHDNIVRLFELVERPNSIWLVLEHQAGASLGDVLERRPALDARAALAIALGVVRALAYLHEHGIVHNDVRPENVWLGDDGRVRLMSLENADSREAPRSAAEAEDGSARSAPFYQSPEQLLGDPTQAPSDVFALGVLLYRLLAGRLPWGETDPASIRQAMRQSPPAALGELGAEAPPGLERVVQRCLEKEPQQRFASAGELELAFGSLLAQTSAFEPEVSVRDVLARSGLLGEGAAPSLARVPSSRLGRERQLKVALGALVLSALALSTGGLFFQRSALHEAVRSGEPSTRPLAAYGALRVVAEPWAHVFVDGQFMDTTPFAAPLLLTPGTHHLRLEHPQARPERRQVEVAAGESLFLDVQLQLYNAPRDGGALPLVVAPSADAGLPIR